MNYLKLVTILIFASSCSHYSSRGLRQPSGRAVNTCATFLKSLIPGKRQPLASSDYLKKQQDLRNGSDESITLFSFEKNGVLHWLPERGEMHQSIVMPIVRQDVYKLSEGLDKSDMRKKVGKPILLLTRGNSGSGKSYILKNGKEDVFEDLGIGRLIQESPDGAVNPDNIKRIIQEDIEEGKVSSQQIHEEGSILAKELIKDLFNEGHSFVIDKRFGTLSSLEGVAKKAKDRGYHVIVVDVDADVAVSSFRVGKRETGGESPNLPFMPILDGFEEARTHRQSIAESNVVDEYYSYSSGESVASRSKSDSGLVISDLEEWKAITSKPSKEHIDKVKAMFESLLNHMASVTSEDFLKLPKNFSVDGPLFKAIEGDEVTPFRNQAYYESGVNEYLRRVRQYGLAGEHENLSLLIAEYLKRTVGIESFSISNIAETATKNPYSKLTVKVSKDNKYVRWLVGHGSFNFRIIDEKERVVTLELVTRDMAPLKPLQVGGEFDSSTVDHLKLWEPSLKTYTFKYVQKMNDEGRLVDSPDLFDISSKIKMIFSDDKLNQHFSYGLRSDVIQAFTLSAQTGIFLLRNATRGSSEYQLLEKQVLQELRSAEELSAFIEYFLKNKNNSNVIINANDATLNNFSDWISHNSYLLKLLKEAVIDY